MALFVFQNILHEDPYTLHAFEPIFEALFPDLLRYFQNMLFERINRVAIYF